MLFSTFTRSVASTAARRSATSTTTAAARRTFTSSTVGATNLRARHISQSDFNPVMFTAVTTVATVSAILFRGMVKRKVKKQVGRASLSMA